MNYAQMAKESELEFSNEESYLTLTTSYGKESTWDSPYKLWFNGELHSYKTPKSFNNKMQYFIDKYQLEQVVNATN